MTDILTIALNRLTPWKGNVRKTGAAEGIDELAASIAAHGQLQALVVRESKRGKYEVIAGRRRYLALSQLAKLGLLDKAHPVNCTLASEETDAAELSLAENVVRVAMHPADQFEAFSRLMDSGASASGVAARFGVTETLIAQRMKLGRLSPVILQAYRDEDIDLETAQAFAISDDQSAQERVYAELPAWNCSAYAVRRALTEGEIRATDKRVRFIGLDAYEVAGGAVRRDLFGNDGDAFLLDSNLLDNMVAEKLKAVAAQVSAEGWLWTDIVVDIEHNALARFTRAYPESVPLSDTHQAELDRLSAEYDELSYTDDSDDSERLDVIQQRIDELNAIGQHWPDEVVASAGAVVSLNYDGSVCVERGLVRREHCAADDPDSPYSEVRGTASQPKGLSPKLIEDLTAQKTAAIGATLMGRPDVALTAVVHALALDVFYPGCSSESCLRLSARPGFPAAGMTNSGNCRAIADIEREHDRFGDHLPANPDALWNWLLERSRDELLDLLAFIAARSVDVMQRRDDRAGTFRLVHGGALAGALQLDMAVWFSPTAESYFSRVSRAQILDAIDDATGSHAPALEKLKKSELAFRAEQLVAGKAWLPEPLRIASEVADNDIDTETAE